MDPTTATQDPLAQLRDIHLPEPVTVFAFTPGWILLAIVAALVLGYAVLRLLRWWLKQAYRRQALRELDGLQQSFLADNDAASYLQQLTRLLKRVALSHFPRDRVASLSGEAWVAFLDRTGRTNDFSMGPGQVLIQGGYEQAPEFDPQQLHRLGALWIRQHRQPPESPS
jgi:hypothetical protein